MLMVAYRKEQVGSQRLCWGGGVAGYRTWSIPLNTIYYLSDQTFLNFEKQTCLGRNSMDVSEEELEYDPTLMNTMAASCDLSSSYDPTMDGVWDRYIDPGKGLYTYVVRDHH